MAQNLLHGIAAGTDNFQNPNTDFTAFELAASLMRKGAVRTVRVQPRIQDTEALQSLVQRPQQPIQRPNMQRPNITRPQAPQQRSAPAQVQTQPSQNFPRRDSQADLQQKRTQIQEMLKREQLAQPTSDQQQNLAPSDQGSTRKPPSDWLTPKVYKGSSDLNN